MNFAATTSAPETTNSDAPDKATRGVTPRVVVFSLLLAALFGYIIPIIDIKYTNTFLGSVHLPVGAIAALLFVLVLLNPLLRLVGRRFMLSRNEGLVVFISGVFASLVPGHGAENFFIGNLIAPFYYANPENRWLNFLQGNLPSWFSPALSKARLYEGANRSAVENWYTGSLGSGVPWGVWLVPLLAWGSLILVSYVMLACLGVMLRAQWAEREALSFPLLRLPLEMTADLDEMRRPSLGEVRERGARVLGAFFGNPLMWIGFGVAVFIEGMNGLNFYFADVPAVPMGINLAALFTEAPWNQLGSMGLTVMPLMLGITFLLTSEVSFSLWFFLWLMQLQLVVAYYIGFMPSTLPAMIGHVGDGATRTFLGYQQIGAFFAYTLLVMWTARRHLSHIAKRAFGRAASTREERGEMFSYPVAFWGFFASLFFILAWTVAAGASPGVALFLWTCYLVISVGLTRVVVEAGLFVAQQGWTPIGALAQITGSGAGTILPTSSLVPATFLQSSLMTDMRAFLLPSFLHSFKLAHDRGISKKPLLALIAAVVLITFVMGVYMRVQMGYTQGGGLGFNGWFANVGGSQPAINTQNLRNGATGATWLNIFWVILGGLTTLALMAIRSRFPAFPLHPIGQLVALSAPIQRFWFTVFLGWLCKVLITRFGGTETYRKTVPFFLGLILGDVSMMILWLAIDCWQDRHYHVLIP